MGNAVGVGSELTAVGSVGRCQVRLAQLAGRQKQRCLMGSEPACEHDMPRTRAAPSAAGGHLSLGKTWGARQGSPIAVPAHLTWPRPRRGLLSA